MKLSVSNLQESCQNGDLSTIVKLFEEEASLIKSFGQSNLLWHTVKHPSCFKYILAKGTEYSSPVCMKVLKENNLEMIDLFSSHFSKEILNENSQILQHALSIEGFSLMGKHLPFDKVLSFYQDKYNLHPFLKKDQIEECLKKLSVINKMNNAFNKIESESSRG